MKMIIRKLNPDDLSWVEKTMTAYFGSSVVVSRGVLHDSRKLPGFIAEDQTGRVGLLHYRIVDDECEVVTLISIRQRKGTGRKLLERVERMAVDAGCKRVWLITTNNNENAIQFYLAVGWKQVAIHKGAVSEARKLKPEIPLFDDAGNPIEDEIEFELRLKGD